MIKIKRQYRFKTIRRNIAFVTKGDYFFDELTGFQTDIASYLISRILNNASDGVFYTMYIYGLPAAVISVSRASKYVWMYVDSLYRTRDVLNILFEFLFSKGGEFITGTVKENDRFIDFAEKNGWEILAEDDKEIFYKITRKTL